VNARSIAFLTATVVVVFVAACGKDDTTSPGPSDTTPPSIVMTSPDDVYHVTVTFDEEVSKTTAENPDNYLLVANGYSAAMMLGVPGDTMRVTPVLATDHRTVVISVYPAMVSLTMGLTTYGISDTHGNRMDTPDYRTFASGTDADQTPPQIFARSPAPGSTNAPIGAPVVIQFSEPVDKRNFLIEWESGSGAVDYYLDVDGARITMTPRHLLAYNDEQTISLLDVRDLIGNPMPGSTWSFVTTRVPDTTKPTVVTTSPKDHALNVDVTSNISITFSEPINQFQFDVAVNPGLPADGIWSEDGKTFTLYPWAPLGEDQQYVVTVYPGGVTDLAGNTVASVTSAVFSTGSDLESGSISGAISGQPLTAAADPTGAIVVAGWYVPYAYTPVKANDTYLMSYLEDGSYGLFVFKDTNGDGDPAGDGDALGAYGADPAAGDFDWDILQIDAGAHLGGIDFPLFDPSYVTGTVTYNGGYQPDYSIVYVGLFEKAGFDFFTSKPIAVSGVDSPYGGKWSFNNIDEQFADGDYYVGSFIDIDENGAPQHGIDPYGIYGGLVSPTIVHLSHGSDVLGAAIEISDPSPTTSSLASTPWRKREHSDKFQHLCDTVHAAGRAALRVTGEAHTTP
jgi:hypothetical protein